MHGNLRNRRVVLKRPSSDVPLHSIDVMLSEHRLISIPASLHSVVRNDRYRHHSPYALQELYDDAHSLSNCLR